MQRAFDALVAGLGLVLLSPLLIIICFIIKTYDRGPVLYKARRVGRNGSPFEVYKFRTMVIEADRLGDGITRAEDKRVTPFGKLLRRFKLDEFPQLLNVLKGEMSLVGPRPEDTRYVETYSPEQRTLLLFRPGITSPASLAYRHEEKTLSGDDGERRYLHEILQAKLEIEMEYAARRTFVSDLGVIMKTIAALFR